MGTYSFYDITELLLKFKLAIIFERTKVCKLHEDLVRSDRDFISSAAYVTVLQTDIFQAITSFLRLDN